MKNYLIAFQDLDTGHYSRKVVQSGSFTGARAFIINFMYNIGHNIRITNIIQQSI